MTLYAALLEAGVDLNGPVLVTRNGTFVSRDAYRDTALADGDAVLAMRVVSGG